MKTKAALEICGYASSAQEIADQLNIRPTVAFERGALNPGGRPYELNSLAVTSPLRSTEPLLRHIEWLLGKSGLRAHTIGELPPDVKLGISCELYPEDDNGGYECFDSALLIKLGQLGISLSINVYVNVHDMID